MIKKLSYFFLTITLTMMLFYNAMSYFMAYTYEKEQSWVEIMKNLPDSEFKVIKLNATLYSFTEDTEMEFVNENVTLNHKTYHIFKKQIKDNIVYLYYLRNHTQDNINESVKKMIDDETLSPITQKSSEKKIAKTVLTDYVFNPIDYSTLLTITPSSSKEFAILPNAELHSGFLKRLYSPPKTV